MYKIIVTTLVSSVLLSTAITPAAAQTHALANSNQMRAGFYLTIPFSGGLKAKDENQLRYGFKAGFQRDYRTDLSFTGIRQQFNANLLDFRFSQQGFKAFSLAGQDLYRINYTKLGAAEGESTLTSTNILYAVGAVAVIGLGVVLLSKDECPKGAEDCGIFVER